MKFLPLLWANLWRRKFRTILTIGSFLVALFLFGLLVTIRTAFNAGVEVAGADRVIIINKVSIIQPLPLAYREKLLRIPGIKEVAYASWFGGVYQDEKNFFAQFAVDPASWHALYPEYLLTDKEWADFAASRTAAIAGEFTAKRFGWKVGDRIPIRGVFFEGTWEFDLVGIYKGSRKQDDTSMFWFRTDYLHERGPDWAKGTVGWYIARTEPGVDVATVSKAVDDNFANSSFETRTQSEQFFMASWMKQMGNIEFLMATIGGVVFFTLLLVAGNSMAMSVRERTGELAVLKALGYGDRFVLGLVLAETLIIAVLGGSLGLAALKVFTLVGGDPTGGLFPVFYFPPAGVFAGIAVIFVVGIAAGLVPALSAMRLHVAQAFRRV